MIAIQLINTLPIIQKLMGLNLPIKKAYKIYTLAKLINDKRDFFINEEKKIIDKFDGNLTESGNIIFKDEETQIKFSQEHYELMNYEIDDIEIIELSFNDFEGAELSALEIAALEGLIKFID